MVAATEILPPADIFFTHKHRSPSVKWESGPCPVCDSSLQKHVISGPDRLNRREGWFSVVRCMECGLLRTDPRPTPETMGYFYPSTYQPFRASAGPEPKEQNLSLKQRLARTIFDLRSDSVPNIGVGSLFEVGTGSGGFLRKMRARGWTVSGLEVSRVAVDRARQLGLDIEQATVETGLGPSRPVDVVAAWMVLEHLHQPVVGLKRIRNWLKDDGWFIGSVPNVASLDFRIFQNAWYALQVPTHLFHFTPKTLSKALEAGGFSVDKIFHQRTLSNYPPSIAYTMEDRWGKKTFSGLQQSLLDFPVKSPPWVSLALYPAAYMAAALGQTGRMTFWARKAR